MNKKMMVFGMMSSALLLSGCTQLDETIEKTDRYAQEKLSSVSVPFDWFKLDNVPKEQSAIKWAKVDALTLPEKDTSKSTLKSYEELLEVLNVELTNKKAMERFAEGNYSSRETFPFFANMTASDDVFGDAVRSVYSKPYQFVQSTTLTGVGKQMVDGKERSIVSFTMNSVNDSEKFLTHDFVFVLNEKNEVLDVQLNQESNRINTLKPLTKEGELVEGVHKEFQYAWGDITSLPNRDNWKSFDKGTANSWMAGFGLEPSSAAVLHKWYQMNEGKLSRGKVTGYLHTDHEALAQTWYEITYPHKNSDETTSITVVYDRGLNKLVELKNNSPFTYKGE